MKRQISVPEHEADLINAEWDEMQAKSKMNIEEFKEFMDKRGREILGERWKNILDKINRDSEMLHREIVDYLNLINR